MATDRADEDVDPLDAFRQFFALERDVLVLSLSMLAFSLAFQMTSRYLPEYMRVLGASAGVIGLYGSVGNLISAVYPYPGGALSDRLGSRFALTAFAVLATVYIASALRVQRETDGEDANESDPPPGVGASSEPKETIV